MGYAIGWNKQKQCIQVPTFVRVAEDINFVVREIYIKNLQLPCFQDVYTPPCR